MSKSTIDHKFRVNKSSRGKS